MEHSEATESMAAARYLLGELSEDEKNAFEEHFFGCPRCAEEVKDGSTLIETLRAERRHAQPVVDRTLTSWWLAAAAAVAVGFLAYQNFTLRRAASPRVLPSYSLLTIGTRGMSETVIEHASSPFAMYVDIPAEPPYPKYRIDIRNTAGSSRARFDVSAEEGKNTVTLYVPGHTLEPGTYTLLIFGLNEQRESEIARSRLVVR